jgi:type IV pilus assembly protein PilY1
MPPPGDASFTGPTASPPGTRVTSAPSGSAFSNETAYVGTWTDHLHGESPSARRSPTGRSPCRPPRRPPAATCRRTPRTAPPDRDTVIKWVRGLDSQGDEKGPGNGVTVRGSIHGDVLHSRPLVVNYGDSARHRRLLRRQRRRVPRRQRQPDRQHRHRAPGRRAVGPDPARALPVPQPPARELAGTEVPVDHPDPSAADRRTTSSTGPPACSRSSTPTARSSKSYLYLTMRRGGRFIYAMDVSQPAVAHECSGRSATDHRVRGTGPDLVAAAPDAAAEPDPTPVVIFGGGYDPSQDTEPPTTATMGRGIYIVDADTGALIWSASPAAERRPPPASRSTA